MRTLLFGSLVAGALVLGGCGSGDVGKPPTSTPIPTNDEQASRATRAMFAGIGTDQPGRTIAVGRDGRVVYAEGFGAARLEPRRPMTTDTVVDIGSTSKQFTATAVLLLADRGKIDLDARLSRYRPDLTH